MLQQFGKYWLEDKLGEGDMGTTYKASHPSTPDPLVIKILDKVDTSSQMRRGGAVEIMQMAASFQHARLHPIREVVEVEEPGGGGKLALAMPMASRRSLADVLHQEESVPGKVALRIIAQIASALEFLHEQEVAHGSIKPTNILLDDEYNITLTDMSMAHLREYGMIPRQPTHQHLLFMPPEREYHSAPEMIGDVFSLGVVTYLLLAGKMPWLDADPEARPIVEAGRLPVPIAAVLRRELNPQIRFRYQTLRDYMLALKEAMSGKVDKETQRLFGVTATGTLNTPSME